LNFLVSLHSELSLIFVFSSNVVHFLLLYSRSACFSSFAALFKCVLSFGSSVRWYFFLALFFVCISCWMCYGSNCLGCISLT
jgi:hypothetical protein